jgi:hypothetical protein
MLPSCRFGCAGAWLGDVVVVVYGSGRVHRAPASSAWLCWSRLVLPCSWLHFQVLEISGRCVLQVASSVLPLPSYRLGCASASTSTWLADVFVVVYG